MLQMTSLVQTMVEVDHRVSSYLYHPAYEELSDWCNALLDGIQFWLSVAIPCLDGNVGCDLWQMVSALKRMSQMRILSAEIADMREFVCELHAIQQTLSLGESDGDLFSARLLGDTVSKLICTIRRYNWRITEDGVTIQSSAGYFVGWKGTGHAVWTKDTSRSMIMYDKVVCKAIVRRILSFGVKDIKIAVVPDTSVEGWSGILHRNVSTL